MSYTYSNCFNLITATCGPNVTNMYYTYYNCKNLNEGIFYSNKVSMVRGCFGSKDNSKIFNLYVPENSTTLSKCLNTLDYASLVGANVTWTEDNNGTGTYWYNSTYNIYIYTFANNTLNI